ncbi:Cytidine deaminase [Pannonibacter phragmitetus]|uniref:Cytidine deaminase n=1 Tax=Pannonibacter phragmitetus TaxID=121719 RepID=A0A378ZQS8_9HYPH|nr:cytidine deaminase [Pannonibacter phragmitetus]SUA99616.1 Cytidine deaminase [Pannonibacter phragmitetus]
MSAVDKLFEAAKAARENAYARYSDFKVGAAILAADGKIYPGCNVENAAYPQGVCAEAGAISAMVLAGQQQIEEVVVIADAALCTPCGGCRQKLKEFAAGSVKVHIANLDGIRRTFTIDELLPAGFQLLD